MTASQFPECTSDGSLSSPPEPRDISKFGFTLLSPDGKAPKSEETMTRTTLDALFLTLLLSSPFIAGCGSDSDLAGVKGRVTLNDEPLEGAIVEFQPTSADGSPSSGRTDPDGRYKLMYTFDTPGTTTGEHIVMIRTAGTFFDEEGNEIEREETVPAKYNGHAELKRTVEPGNNTFNFDL